MLHMTEILGDRGLSTKYLRFLNILIQKIFENRIKFVMTFDILYKA